LHGGWGTDRCAAGETELHHQSAGEPVRPLPKLPSLGGAE